MAARLLQFVLTLLCLSFIVYGLIGLMPGDPVDLMLAGNPRMTAEDAENLRRLYGLDRPLVARYGTWLASALAGDLGHSRLYSLPVLDVIGPRLLNTLILAGTALFFTVLFAIPLGVTAARHRGDMMDRVINLFCLAGISLPSFWAGLMLMAVFSVMLGWLPAGADLSQGISWRSMILPVATLVLSGLAAYIRHLRSAMTEALAADHIRTARAKGCSDARVTWNHAFRNALPPVITLFMLDIGVLLGGAVTVETIFAWPGMGKLMFDAVMGNDYNLALSGFLILATAVLAANFMADLLYRLADPRVKAGGAK